MVITCPYCAKRCTKRPADVRRAERAGLHIYCSRRCSGLGRRTGQTEAERKQVKAEYDRIRRLALAEEIRAKKRDYFRRTYTPEKGRLYRQTRTFDHTAYCRRYYSDPAKKQEKVAYDKRFRAVKRVGEYAECMILLNELWKEIRKQEPSWYERAKSKGFLLKLQEKKHGRQDRCFA